MNRKRFLLSISTLFLALSVWVAWAQPPTVTNNFWRIIGAASTANPVLQVSGSDANITGDLTAKGTGSVRITSPFLMTSTTSPIFTSVQTDYVVFFPAVQYCNTDIAWSTAANLIPTRLAANDFALARTAVGAETYNIRCAIPLLWRTTASKGSRLDTFSISQQITVVALTSNTFNALSTTTYANNVANAVAGYGGAITITMPTATQAAPYLTAGTLATAAFMNTANVQVGLDFTVVMANTGVYRLYGVAATYTEALY